MMSISKHINRIRRRKRVVVHESEKKNFFLYYFNDIFGNYVSDRLFSAEFSAYNRKGI